MKSTKTTSHDAKNVRTTRPPIVSNCYPVGDIIETPDGPRFRALSLDEIEAHPWAPKTLPTGFEIEPLSAEAAAELDSRAADFARRPS